jgi:hypothetical protein
MDLAFDDMFWLVLGLNRGRRTDFLNYLGAPMILYCKKQRKLSINREKDTFCVKKSFE